MATKASEISELIKAKIENFDHEAQASDIGTVVSVTDGITRIHGLNEVQYGDILQEEDIIRYEDIYNRK